MVTGNEQTEIEVVSGDGDLGVFRLELQLPHTTQSVRRARRTIAAFLDLSEVPISIIDDLLLLVSELVTNAVVHAGSPPVVRLDADVERIKVAVSDGAAMRAPHLTDPDQLTSSGRGVLLVDRLAARWGVEPHREGKVVWFELPRTG